MLGPRYEKARVWESPAAWGRREEQILLWRRFPRGFRCAIAVKCRFRFPLCRAARLVHGRLELFSTLTVVERHLVFSCPRFHLQTETPGRMRHGLGQDLLRQARPVLDEGRRDRVYEPVFEHPNAADAAGGSPPPAGEQGRHIHLQRNPFQQVFQGGDKVRALLFVFDVIAGKMTITAPTRELSAGIAKAKKSVGASQHVS